VAIARTSSTLPTKDIALGAQVPRRRGSGCNELVTPVFPRAAPAAPHSLNDRINQHDNEKEAALTMTGTTVPARRRGARNTEKR